MTTSLCTLPEGFLFRDTNCREQEIKRYKAYGIVHTDRNRPVIYFFAYNTGGKGTLTSRMYDDKGKIRREPPYMTHDNLQELVTSLCAQYLLTKASAK